MKIIMFIIPSFLMLVCLGLYLNFYKLDGQFKEDILNNIEKRRYDLNEERQQVN